MADVVSRLTAALSDRSRVVRELGAGGMATVYLAHDHTHERDVAIKVLHPDVGAALGAERFLSGIKTPAKLTPCRSGAIGACWCRRTSPNSPPSTAPRTAFSSVSNRLRAAHQRVGSRAAARSKVLARQRAGPMLRPPRLNLLSSGAITAAPRSAQAPDAAYGRVAKARACLIMLEGNFGEKVTNSVIGKTAASRGRFLPQGPGRVSITFTGHVGDCFVATAHRSGSTCRAAHLSRCANCWPIPMAPS